MTKISDGIHRLRSERQRALHQMRRRLKRNRRENSRLLRQIARAEDDLKRLDRMERGLSFRLIPSPQPGMRLTRREREVMELLRDDLSNKEIGAQLCLSERTAKYHVSNLLAKYGVDRRIKLTTIARAQAA